MSAPETLLEVSQLDVAYGSIQVLWGVSMDVYSRELVALIGSNGAGKSTLMAAIANLLPWKGGDVLYRGQSVSGFSSQETVGLGIALIPQGRHLFAGMSVLENLMMGAYLRTDGEGIASDLENIFSLFPVLEKRRHQDSGKLSGGEQQMCAIARGLMSRPSLLVIDELSLGLSPFLVDSLYKSVKEINQEGTTMLLVEQDVQLALESSERAYVMEGGRIAGCGRSGDLLQDESIRSTYLGL